MKHGGATEPIDRYRYTRQSPLENAQRAHGRVRTFLSALFIGIFLVYSRRNAPASLPGTYGICASGGGKIYNLGSVSPEVECIIVSGTNVVDSGDLVQMKGRWGDGAASPSMLRNLLSSYAGTPLFFLKSGQAVYPGFTDSHAHVLGMPLMGMLLLSHESL